MNRLSQLPTLKIDPEAAVSVAYRDTLLKGVGGDTVATLLYANGVRVLGRSLKYHRPRGLYSLDGESGNTLMNIDGLPNTAAETTPAENGMRVAAQNVMGKPERDWMGFMDWMSPLMPAGFYYRMFHRPAAMWPHVIKRIRKAAGLGEMTVDFRMKGHHDECYLNAEVCVIGGGPAGMTAALAAAEAGRRVILLESRPWLGGFYDYRPGLGDRGADLAARVAARPEIRVLTRTAAIGAYPDRRVTAWRRGGAADDFDTRYIEVRADAVVSAAGCVERPLLFAHNERPGVMQVNCAHRLARTWGILAGTAAVFSVGDDLGLEAAVDLSDLGMAAACVADVREDGQDPALVRRLSDKGISLLRGWVAVRAHGKPMVSGVDLATLSGTRVRTMDCDLLVASAGLTPVTGPLTLAGAKLAFNRHTGFFLPVDSPEWIYPAGRTQGYADAEAIEASGRLAGLRAGAAIDHGNGRAFDQGDDAAIRAAEAELARAPGPARGSKFVIGPGSGEKTFICFDEDTTVKNVDQAMAMGFDVPELIKRFTAAGTGPSQGGVPGHNLPLYVGLTGDSPDADPRPTTVRPPLAPTLLATYAGANRDLFKRTPIHDMQVEDGGRMERIGVWMRARRFSDDPSASDEIRNVRQNVGMLDASTLGKFRIFGPDALKALDRVYVGDMGRVKGERLTYSAMCNQDGCIIDDGVLVKRGENDYYFTTSTGRAGSAIEWIRYHARYEDWDFHIVNLTDAFGVINLAGPNARKVLEQLTAADVSNEAFPFMGYRELGVASIPVRAMRLGFVGELSFELHVEAFRMAELWRALKSAGEPLGIRNFGLAAQNALRMEKGHLIIGSESEQRTTLHDVGLGFLWHADKRRGAALNQTVGAAALAQTEHREGRLKLVGIEMVDDGRPPADGSIIVDDTVRGYIATACRSEAVGKSIGMALVESELAAVDTTLEIYEGGADEARMTARVAPMPFYDPEGRRLRM